MKRLLQVTALSLLTAMGGYAQTGVERTMSNDTQGAAFSDEGVMLRSESKEFWIKQAAAASYAGGSGTKADPYLIETPEQLLKLQNEANGGSGAEFKNLLSGVYFKQVADIDLSKYYSNGFGIGLNGYFSGVYDGNGYEIRGYKYVADSDTKYKGEHIIFSLFGNVKGATIKNVTMADYLLDMTLANEERCTYSAGMLVALVNDSRIENCTVSGDVKFTVTGNGNSLNIGGIAGLSRENNVIDDCHAFGSITLTQNYTEDAEYGSFIHGSGIAGQAFDGGSIINCTSDMKISTQASGSSTQGTVVRSAGITGWSDNLKIINCSSRGSLSAKGSNSVADKTWVQVGGIGSCILNSTVQNCWNVADVSSEGGFSDQPAQSIVCYWENTTKQNNFYNKNAAGALGSIGDVAKTSQEMKSPEFVEQLNKNLPEGALEWNAVEGDYPVLHVSGTQTANEQIVAVPTTTTCIPVEGGVRVQAEETTPVAIYTFQGVLQKAETVQGTFTFELPQGLYIVKAGEQTYKVSVK